MLLVKHASALRESIARAAGSIGFVPTMGALHPGHMSLLEKSRSAHAITVCSIFVNPTQFNDPKDFEKYPVTIEHDIYLLEEAGCDILFLPTVSEIYPDGLRPAQHYDLGYLETILEGKYRPGHFQGVCQVVHRLLDIVQPGRLYLGQKDYQQCKVLQKLLELTGMDKTIQIVINPTLREEDGLAMSSRNKRLTPTQRIVAPEIYHALSQLAGQLKAGPLDSLKQEAMDQLGGKGFRADYVEIADADSLELLSTWDGKRAWVVLAAAFLDEIRLIDNILGGTSAPS